MLVGCSPPPGGGFKERFDFTQPFRIVADKPVMTARLRAGLSQRIRAAVGTTPLLHFARDRRLHRNLIDRLMKGKVPGDLEGNGFQAVTTAEKCLGLRGPVRVAMFLNDLERFGVQVRFLRS